jgi:hypothetical protein
MTQLTPKKRGGRRKNSGRPKGARNKQLNPKVARAIDMLAEAVVKKNDETITNIAAQVGMSREGLSAALRRDDITARVLARVRQRLGTVALLKAGARLEELIHAKSEYVALEASSRTLAISGVKAVEVPAAIGGVTVNLQLRYVSRPEVPIDITPVGPSLPPLPPPPKDTR